MNIILKKLDKKKLVKNFIKIKNMSRISNWSFKNYNKNLPGKWEESIIVYNKINDEIVAFCISSKNYNSLHIHLLIVSFKYQNLGIGTKILQKLINRNNKNITVKTYSNLKKTIRFYLKNDFKIIKSNINTTFLKRNN